LNYAFANRFRELLKETDNIQLEKFLAVSSSALRQWRNGYSLPSCENIYKLTEYFNCSADYLLGLDNFSADNHKLKYSKAFGESYVSFNVSNDESKVSIKAINDDSCISFEVINEIVSLQFNIRKEL